MADKGVPGPSAQKMSQLWLQGRLDAHQQTFDDFGSALVTDAQPPYWLCSAIQGGKSVKNQKYRQHELVENVVVKRPSDS